MISEVPYEVTFATTKRPRRKIVDGVSILYRQIKKELFFGFELVEGIYIARKEKAYLDCVYFKLTGKTAGYILDAVFIEELNRKLLLQYGTRYPDKVQRYVQETGSRR